MTLHVPNTQSRAPSNTPSAAALFFKRWIANPLSMGSVTPSSATLRRHIARNVICGDDEIVVEFGGGTGAITQGLLENGIPSSKLYTLEIDGELANYLRAHFPTVNIVEGDARQADALIPAQYVGKVGTVVVGIPMVMLPLDLQREIVDAIFRIMPAGRRFLLYTYCINSPLPTEKLGLKAERLVWTPLNIPPASVFAYSKA
ncbi:MAG TPA: phospholipid methyltransferase [Azospirillaceae bacterium]|nr:phospholipid methyltransferase [Azospirillaceae bacterium]